MTSSPRSDVPEGAITAAEYARRCDPPMGKPAMSRLFARGLPHYPGSDDHGRICKYVLPSEADEWRAANCRPTFDPRSGAMRGVPDVRPQTAARASAASAPSGAALPSSPSAGSPGGGGGGSGDGGETLSAAVRIQEARATSAEEDAAWRRLRRETLQGALLDRKAAVDAHLTFVGMVAQALDRMPADRATVVAADLGVTEHEAFKVLRDVSQRLREDLAQAARREAARLEATE